MSDDVKQKWFDCIEEWHKSGLSQKLWCEKNAVRYSVFHYWYKQYRVRPGDLKDGFVRLMVNDTATTSGSCELVLTSGHKFIFHQPLTAAFIRSLID